MPTYYCYIFAGDGQILSIQQETFKLQETILQENKYCIFYQQELRATPDKNGTEQVSSVPKKFKLLVNIPTSNLKVMSKKLKKDRSTLVNLVTYFEMFHVLPIMSGKRICLASGSPRRKELIENMVS